MSPTISRSVEKEKPLSVGFLISSKSVKSRPARSRRRMACGNAKLRGWSRWVQCGHSDHYRKHYDCMHRGQNDLDGDIRGRVLTVSNIAWASCSQLVLGPEKLP